MDVYLISCLIGITLLIIFNFLLFCLFFKGCVDDIVTVLAEEHGCLDIIKVCETSLLFHAVLSRIFYYCCVVFHIYIYFFLIHLSLTVLQSDEKF